jgi:hypothetical protein
MKESDALELIGNPVLLEQFLLIRLVQLADEDNNVAIRAIELLRGTELPKDDVLSGLTVGELQQLENRVTEWLIDEHNGTGESSPT